MSRIGRKPVELPAGVTVTATKGRLNVKGPKGALDCKIADGITFQQEGNIVTTLRSSDAPRFRSYHGLMRALLNNMVIGVTAGFEKKLEIIGVGYKAEKKGNAVVFNLGYSHPIQFPFPDGITVDVDGGTKITVKGINKEHVGQAAAIIRGFRPPDRYKGKGVRYQGEYVRIKAGKTGQ